MAIRIPQLVDDIEPVEWVGEPKPSRVLVFTIHDGTQLPRAVLGDQAAALAADPVVQRAYVAERDWGANLVAERVAAELGLGGYLRVNLARVLLDYGRFPGVSDETEEDYLLRKSVYPPVVGRISQEAIHTLITRYYDAISRAITEAFADKLVTLGIHTYDPRNRSGTLRPEVSLVTRSLNYQWRSSLPPWIFDPLFPAILCESTCHKALTYQTVLNLERNGWDVALNHPYVMPEGSVEIRAQVWFFFRHLRARFGAAEPQTRDDPAYQRVWQMVLDTTRRSADCELLRGYLHRYREAPAGMETLFAAARRAYGHIKSFLAAHRDELVHRYRTSSARPSCLGVEVRKDLLYDIDCDHLEARRRADAEERASDVARMMAAAVRSYLDQVAPPMRPPAGPGFEHAPAQKPPLAVS